jgi:hypothetical protein
MKSSHLGRPGCRACAAMLLAVVCLSAAPARGERRRRAEASATRAVPPAFGYRTDEVCELADTLTRQLGVAAYRRAAIISRLSAWIAQRTGARGELPVSGVFAYQMGSGGFIFKAGKGVGLLRLYGEPIEHPLRLKAVSVGAQLGGTSEIGIGVILGETPPLRLSGKYRMVEASATVGAASGNVIELVPKRDFPVVVQRVILLRVASGFAANAGGGWLTLTVGP